MVVIVFAEVMNVIVVACIVMAGKGVEIVIGTNVVAGSDVAGAVDVGKIMLLAVELLALAHTAGPRIG